MRLPGEAEQLDQRLKLRVAEVAQLLLVAIADGLVELLEQSQSRVGNADMDDAAVVSQAPSRDEPALLQAIDETRDVGGV
jgi:hypothetical protein